MLDVLIVVYVQLVIMLTELQKVLSQEPKCLCSKTTTVPLEWTVPKTMDVSLLHFYCSRNKDVVYKCTYTVWICRPIYTIHTVQVHMSTNSIVMHYVG